MCSGVLWCFSVIRVFCSMRKGKSRLYWSENVGTIRIDKNNDQQMPASVVPPEPSTKSQMSIPAVWKFLRYCSFIPIVPGTLSSNKPLLPSRYSLQNHPTKASGLTLLLFNAWSLGRCTPVTQRIFSAAGVVKGSTRGSAKGPGGAEPWAVGRQDCSLRSLGTPMGRCPHPKAIQFGGLQRELPSKVSRDRHIQKPKASEQQHVILSKRQQATN